MSQDFVKNGTNPDDGPVHRFLDRVDRLVLKAWRVFVSLKFGIGLLTLIGVLSIYGTMRYASNGALGDNAIPMARTLFFESRWFVALLLLFACNLILSTWHVTVMSLGIWWKKEFRRGRVYYEHGNSPRAEVKVPGGLDEAEKVLRQKFTRVHRDGDAIFAHAGLLSRLGPTIVHVGMLMVIFSQVAKAGLQWNGKLVTEGRFIAGEGDPASNFINEPVALEQQLTQENRREIAIPYWIRVLDFDEIKHANSQMPAYFSSLIEVADPKTQETRVIQLDMNHSVNIGGLQFHQAGFTPAPETEVQRINFDVRDTATGERIAVTDASPGTRVRIGETDEFLEVNGIQPANRWKIFTAADPQKPKAEGLLVGGQELKYSFRLDQFYPEFKIDEKTNEPVSASPQPKNPALQVAILLNDKQVETTWLFLDPSLAAVVPDSHPRFKLTFTDIRVRSGLTAESVDWKEKGAAVFEVKLHDRERDVDVGTELLMLGESSRPYPYTAKVDHAGDAQLGTEAGYEVRILGPTQRFATVLSVVKEPTVPWTKAGVVITVLGALMTFVFRYRALYGWLDAERGSVRLALVPRWGQTAITEEFEKLVAILSHGKGAVRRHHDNTTDEVAPAHDTA